MGCNSWIVKALFCWITGSCTCETFCCVAWTIGFPIVAVLLNLPIEGIWGVIEFWGCGLDVGIWSGGVSIIVTGDSLSVVTGLLLTDNWSLVTATTFPRHRPPWRVMWLSSRRWRCLPISRDRFLREVFGFWQLYNSNHNSLRCLKRTLKMSKVPPQIVPDISSERTLKPAII